MLLVKLQLDAVSPALAMEIEPPFNERVDSRKFPVLPSKEQEVIVAVVVM